MTDKVQKIREEVVGIINSINLFTPDEDGKNSSYEAGKLDMASKILQIINSMQKEPKFKIGDRISFKHYKENRLKIINVGDKGYFCEDGTFLHYDNQYLWELVEPKECMYSKGNYTDEDRKSLCDGCTEECRYSKKEESVNNGIDLGCGVIWKDEEPVSEDFEAEVKKLWMEINTGHSYSIVDSYNMFYGLCMDIAEWQKENLWKPADGDDLPEIDREVIALLDNGKVGFAHRPPEYWDGKDIVTGKVTRNYPKTYDKGGWNQPHILYWLDARLPYEEK